METLEEATGIWQKHVVQFIEEKAITAPGALVSYVQVRSRALQFVSLYTAGFVCAQHWRPYQVCERAKLGLCVRGSGVRFACICAQSRVCVCAVVVSIEHYIADKDAHVGTCECTPSNLRTRF